ncbi:MAG: DUF86 domain-containing protein [Candidatus Hydrothermarchaeaceae archaeon]
MTNVREDIIRTKIKEIEENVKLVEENLPERIAEFIDLGLVKDGIYKRVEFAIEDVIDICAVLNSDFDLGIPSSEDDIIEHLVRGKVLGSEMGDIVKELKGFRNFLVHRYGKIDDEIAFENIKKGIEDFSKFIEEIESFLEKNQG